MLYTVGHSNRTLEEFVAILHAHSINMIADVRGGRAGSRTFPHFNKEALSASLPSYRVKYIHIPELGGRRGKNREIDPSINDGWRVDAFKNYADYAYTNDEFKKGVGKLIKLQKSARIAFMCSEAVPWRCHRSIITDYLLLIHKIDVTHILGKTQTMKATPHDHAKLVKGKIIFPKQT